MTWLPLRGLVGIVGLLLTPLVAWAASFLGGWLGALVGSVLEGDGRALWSMVIGSALGAVISTTIWVRFLLRYRKKVRGKGDVSGDRAGEAGRGGTN